MPLIDDLDDKNVTVFDSAGVEEPQTFSLIDILGIDNKTITLEGLVLKSGVRYGIDMTEGALANDTCTSSIVIIDLDTVSLCCKINIYILFVFYLSTRFLSFLPRYVL